MGHCANSGADDSGICSRVKQLRQYRGEKQETLAKALGVARTTYNKLESGTNKFSVDMIIRLADYFSVDCDYLLRGYTADHRNICQETGLSENAIAALKGMVPNQAAMLSLLIEHESMGDLLSYQLTAYFRKYGTPPITQFDEKWNDFKDIEKAAYAWACYVLPSDQVKDHFIHQACDLFLQMAHDTTDKSHPEISDKVGEEYGQHS